MVSFRAAFLALSAPYILAAPAPTADTISSTDQQPWYYPGSLPVVQHIEGTHVPHGPSFVELHVGVETRWCPNNGHPIVALVPWVCFDLVTGTEALNKEHDSPAQHLLPNATSTDELFKYYFYIRKALRAAGDYKDQVPQLYDYFSNVTDKTIARMAGRAWIDDEVDLPTPSYSYVVSSWNVFAVGKGNSDFVYELRNASNPSTLLISSRIHLNDSYSFLQMNATLEKPTFDLNTTLTYGVVPSGANLSSAFELQTRNVYYPPQETYTLDPSCRFEIGKNTSCSIAYKIQNEHRIWVNIDSEHGSQSVVRSTPHLSKGTGSFMISLTPNEDTFKRNKEYMLKIDVSEDYDWETYKIISYPKVYVPITIF